MRLRLERLVDELAAKHPLRQSVGPLDETANWEDALKALGPCMIWFGFKRKNNGYGVLNTESGPVYPHRYAYQYAFGSIPDGRRICHHCDNPPCFNPEHLFPGTQSQNLADMRRKGREHKVGSKGEKNPESIYVAEQVCQMRARFSAGEKIAVLQREYGGAYQSIHAIVHGRTWRHLINTN